MRYITNKNTLFLSLNLFFLLQVCYAFRGDIDTITVRIYVLYRDSSGADQHTNLEHESSCSTRWKHECINLIDLATNAEFWENRLTGYPMMVKDIYISKEAMVDDVWIGKNDVAGSCLLKTQRNFGGGTGLPSREQRIYTIEIKNVNIEINPGMKK